MPDVFEGRFWGTFLNVASRQRPAAISSLSSLCPATRHGGTMQLMARIVFTPQLRRFVEVPEVETSAASLREGLEAAFAANPRLRGYVLDEQGHLRANVAIFIDGRRLRDAHGLSDALAADSSVHVLQALSGG
jgi:sulfur-carrier protein